MSAIIAIPASNPTNKLKNVLFDLSQNPNLTSAQIVVINDGSTK